MKIEVDFDLDLDLDLDADLDLAPDVDGDLEGEVDFDDLESFRLDLTVTRSSYQVESTTADSILSFKINININSKSQISI